MSFGKVSQVMTICFLASISALKAKKNSSCVRSLLPPRNWMSSMISRSSEE